LYLVGKTLIVRESEIALPYFISRIGPDCWIGTREACDWAASLSRDFKNRGQLQNCTVLQEE